MSTENETDSSESECEYEVERIIAKKFSGRSTQYLVKWKGYPSSENTWEPASNLRNAPLLLSEFNGRSMRKTQISSRVFNKLPPSSSNAFERGLMPEEIICLIDDGSQVRFLIKFLFQDELEIVTGDDALANCPILLHDFCERINGI